MRQWAAFRCRIHTCFVPGIRSAECKRKLCWYWVYPQSSGRLGKGDFERCALCFLLHSTDFHSFDCLVTLSLLSWVFVQAMSAYPLCLCVFPLQGVQAGGEMPTFFSNINPFLTLVVPCHNHDLGTACPPPVRGTCPAYTVKAMYLGTIVYRELTHTLNGAPCHLHPSLRDSATTRPWPRTKSCMRVLVLRETALEFNPNRSTRVGSVCFRTECSLSGHHPRIHRPPSSQSQATWKWEDQDRPRCRNVCQHKENNPFPGCFHIKSGAAWF